MKESEAKTKWCPFARLLTEVGTGNRVLCKDVLSINDEPTNCIGSECMAWRIDTLGWSLADWVAYKKMDDEEKAKFTPPKETDGHCGLAGKP